MPAAYASESFRSRKFYPFAFLVSDFARQTSRLAAVERALEQPGEQGSDTLLAGLLKRDSEFDRSSLEPREGLLPLIDLSIGARPYQVMLIMDRRRSLCWIELWNKCSVATGYSERSVVPSLTRIFGLIVLRHGACTIE
jgi:hypothetical protein